MDTVFSFINTYVVWLLLSLGGNDDEVVRFVQHNLLPHVNEITIDNLQILREHDDGRPIALAILRDDSSSQSISLIRVLRDVTPSNRDFIFAHVDSAKFPSFVETFHIDNTSTLPQLIIWDGRSTYFKVKLPSHSILPKNQICCME